MDRTARSIVRWGVVFSILSCLAAQVVQAEGSNSMVDEPGAVMRLAQARSRASTPGGIAASALDLATRWSNKPLDPEPEDRKILQHKRGQVLSLQRLASTETDHADHLLRLAHLELEVAILAETLGEGSHFEAPAVTCRRILAAQPTFNRADEVRLFLAQLELRSGHLSAAQEVLADLERLHPRSKHLCQAWLYDGKAQQTEGRFGQALKVYHRAVGSAGCSMEVVHQAHYGAAWSLLGLKKFRAAVKTFRFLLGQAHLGPIFRERIVKDLVLAWAMSEVDQDAVALIMAQGPQGPQGRLIQQLAETLMKEQKLAAMLSLTHTFLKSYPEHPQAGAIRQIRLEGIARLSTATALQQELASIPPASPQLHTAMAEALLLLARRLDDPTSPPSKPLNREQARGLYHQLIRSFPQSPGANQARYRLAELLISENECASAVDLLEVVSQTSVAPLHAQAQYQMVVGLSRLLEQEGASGRETTLNRFDQAVWRLVELQPRSPATADALLLLSSRLLQAEKGAEAARAALALLKQTPDDVRQEDDSQREDSQREDTARRKKAISLAIRALEQSAQYARAFTLATGELRSCSSECEWFRRAATVVALKQCQILAQERRFLEAGQWANRAAQVDPEHPGRFDAALTSAAMAVRGGQVQRSQLEYQALAMEVTPHKYRLKALHNLAELHESQAHFSAAARVYLEAVQLGGTLKEQLIWLHRAGQAHALAGEKELAIKRARELMGALSAKQLPVAKVAYWQLRVGSVLELAKGPAARFYINRAMEWRAQYPRISARFLLRAAELPVSRSKAISYLTQALELAGPLILRGRISEMAAQSRLGLARIKRQSLADTRSTGAERLTAGSARKRLLELQALVTSLLQVIKTAHPRYAVEAGLQAAWAYGEMAQTLMHTPVPAELPEDARPRYVAVVQTQVAQLRKQQENFFERLAPRIKQAAQTAAILTELRQHYSPGLTVAQRDIMPASSPVLKPFEEFILQGHFQAAVEGLTRGLKVHGPREDLLCLRGVVRLRRGELALARQDFQSAYQLFPESQCARLNLGGLAVWRGDFAAAEALIAKMAGHDALILQAAIAYGRRQIDQAVILAKRAIRENPRSDVHYLLGVMLIDHLHRPLEGQALLRRCIEEKLGMEPLARERLRRMGEADISGV